MRTFVKSASMGLALAVLAGCTDAPLEPAATPSDANLSELTFDESELQTGEVDVTTWTDETTLLPLHLVTPEVARNIGPGSAILITIPDEGRFGCTANFVWQAGGRRYLGSAGHCFLPSALSATHGEGADYDASGVTVDVCVENCEGNFRSNLLLGTWVRLGQVAYARQSVDGRGVGNDFGLVAIPKEFQDLIRADMPVWGGPTGVETQDLGEFGCHYGNGVGTGEVVLTKARVGVGGGSTDDYWAGDFVASFGDSGSGMVACDSDGVGFHGRGASGVLTHLGVRFDEETGEHGYVLGTTIARSVQMAEEAHLKISIVLP